MKKQEQCKNDVDFMTLKILCRILGNIVSYTAISLNLLCTKRHLSKSYCQELFSLLYWQKSKDNRGITGSLVLIKRMDDDIMSPRRLMLGVSLKLRYA